MKNQPGLVLALPPGGRVGRGPTTLASVLFSVTRTVNELSVITEVSSASEGP